MKVSCGVIRDLLPLVAEDLAGEESCAMVAEHLETCPACQKKLEELKAPKAPAPDGAGALHAVKRDIRRRRLTAALLAALLVFLPLFALFARSSDMVAVPWEKDLMRVDSAENGVLTLSVDGRVSGIKSELCTDPDSGETTLLLQGWSSAWHDAHTHAPERGSFTVSAAPDRVIYGFGEEQTLLYGEPMHGGVLLLPRLVLAYYALMALGAAVVFGLLWLLLRKKKAAPALRALFFAALSYPVGHLLIKGLQTTSFSLPRDLAFILLAAAAVWGLLMLGWTILQRKKQEKD